MLEGAEGRQGRRGRVAVIAVAATIALGACKASQAPATSPSGTPAPPPAEEERWVAAIGVAPLADDLDGDAARVRDAFGRALIVSPIDCFEGLPAQAGEGYLVGAVGAMREEVEELVDQAGEHALFTSPVTILCTD